MTVTTDPLIDDKMPPAADTFRRRTSSGRHLLPPRCQPERRVKTSGSLAMGRSSGTQALRLLRKG